ncbi:SufE family protein [Algicella marina]|uniref:Cysteine desulfuration protein SufE n=1 Tax=Algicella marina TaxID=2683284 RepID=A0A6P1SZG3_9RHOB|nr:SufE family protein [Algicella marina]QHQ34851.1 cysteine desulfuration protein SufE [Algicella marina]
MADTSFEDIASDFEFLDEWEDRYRYVIELGKSLPPMPEDRKVEGTKVNGCASQVWIVPEIEGQGRDAILRFSGDSDAMIVKGLIAILLTIFDDKSAKAILAERPLEAFERLGLTGHLSAQRSNGLHAMIKRIRSIATAVEGQTA